MIHPEPVQHRGPHLEAQKWRFQGIDIVGDVQLRGRFARLRHARPHVQQEGEHSRSDGLEGYRSAIMRIYHEASEEVVGVGVSGGLAGWCRLGGVAEFALEEGALGGAVVEVAFPQVVAMLEVGDAAEDGLQVPEREGAGVGVEVGTDVEVVVGTVEFEILVFDDLVLVARVVA